MSKVYFLLGIHNHQPVGNFENVLEEAYNKSYKPFLDVMFKYSAIRFSLHCSGILWDYFRNKHPEYIEILKEMVRRKQVEIISGGYYEPILCSIPQNDRIGQIKMMNEFIYNTFGTEPQGLWLTERVWEQSVVKDIVDAGIKYTLADDYIFYSAGINRIENPELTDYYVTDEEGRVLYIFPISQTLRYYIPFKTTEDVINLFSKFSKNHPLEITALTMGDDGEKFGLWPKTYEHVYQNKWLEDFLQKIIENKKWLKTATFSEYLSLKPPKQRIYLPTASYFEMGEWSLPTSTQEIFEQLIKMADSIPYKEVVSQFIRGGYWKNFFTKYPEANNMHKKMLYVSEKLKNIEDENLKKTFYKAQCNCAYWHGVFGGLYLPHLREAVYENLIEVEKHIAKKGIQKFDFDKDGQQEVVIETENFGVFIKPSYGGSIFEIDLKKYNKNLLNVLTRKKEAYHNRLVEFEKNNSKIEVEKVKTIHDLVLVKEPGLSKKLYYDWYIRNSFLDHFLHPNTKFEDFYKCQFGEQGNFTIESYELENIDKKNFIIALSRKGSVWIDSKEHNIFIRKEFKVEEDNNQIRCNYIIENLSKEEVSLWFLTELNLMVFNINKEFFGEKITDKITILEDYKEFKINIVLPNKTLIWCFPIEAISLSEAGFERTYQGLCIAPNFRFTLKPQEKYSTDLIIEVI
ncbi:MAG: DUF1926 domain-containing protein [Endomicrobia bacterium]|nr:DUF1926 domain-containing protein [Endomicrobiia bacterium]